MMQPLENSTENRAIAPTVPVTLQQGLELYYETNPTFVRDRDLQVGILRIPWCDLQRHDIMHMVTGYSTDLDDELRLIGFLLTALTWRRPWYYYLENVGVFFELLAQSFRGEAWGGNYLNPMQVCQLYLQGIRQGLTVHKKIDAYIQPDRVMGRSLESLRQEYGIANMGAWDGCVSTALNTPLSAFPPDRDRGAKCQQRQNSQR